MLDTKVQRFYKVFSCKNRFYQANDLQIFLESTSGQNPNKGSSPFRQATFTGLVFKLTSKPTHKQTSNLAH